MQTRLAERVLMSELIIKIVQILEVLFPQYMNLNSLIEQNNFCNKQYFIWVLIIFVFHLSENCDNEIM